MEVLLITTQHEQISYFLAYDENENEIYFDTIREKGRELHYTYREKPLSGDITYEAYSSDDELTIGSGDSTHIKKTLLNRFFSSVHMPF